MSRSSLEVCVTKDEIFEWVNYNFNPEDVFTKEELLEWAIENLSYIYSNIREQK